MHKVNTGQVEMGVLAQAVLDSAASQRLGKEVAAINEAAERGGPPSRREEEGGDGDDDDEEKDGVVVAGVVEASGVASFFWTWR
mmetsp:Transcript_31848/g.63467  ORF Transcript_31848/g.63467 Transcript_31848/m.63467 type:complete len:84 (+) Transcript_31848:226-477(+)